MKGLQPLFLGIFGIFGFSWLGMTVVPNLQIGSLNPQSDEEGTDIYPQPLSGMAARGAQVYAANGCFYCHSQQVRPDYGGSDLERKWGDRRSAPRDYIFEPIVFLGTMRMGPDLANVGHRPLEGAGAATPAPSASPAASPASGTSPGPAVAAANPAGASPSPTAVATASSSASPATGNQPAANTAAATPTAVAEPKELADDGRPLPYTAAWHHRHLYNPRSVSEDSNMPAYRFLYEKRRISGVAARDAINFVGDTGNAPETGWEIVPTYDAQCLVAYLMSRNQSHPLKEAKAAATTAAATSPAKEAKK
jgi:cbb3-type cytochrome oxidase cytochrome c subunit